MLAVGTVEQVVDTRTELQLRTEAVGGVEREGGKTGTRPQVLRDHIALAIGYTMLVGHRAQQCTRTPALALPVGAQACFQRRHLRQRTALIDRR